MTKEDVKKILLENEDLLKKYTVKSVALFGSYVRNTQKDTSDIDLLVEFEENTYKNFINLIFDLENLLQKEVTVVSADDLSPYLRPYILQEAESLEG